MRHLPSRSLFALLLLTGTAACSVGPDYKRPPAIVPAAYKEANGWQVAQPNDAIDRGAWWSVYNDPTLASLEQQVSISHMPGMPVPHSVSAMGPSIAAMISVMEMSPGSRDRA